MTQRTLHLAAGLNLPLETVTQSLTLLAKRRSLDLGTVRGELRASEELA